MILQITIVERCQYF